MRIGFIAMSGLRTQDEELTRMGFTLPGFVERSNTIASLPSLGMLTLAGMTPRDIDLDYVEVEDIRKFDGVPAEVDMVAISSYSAQIKDAYELAARYREKGTTVLLGGLHVTAMPDEALAHADCIVVGEGEPSWPRVVDDLKKRRLQAVYDSRSRPFSLADAPMPRFDMLNPDSYNRITVQTQRGCPYNCEFCAASVRLTPTYQVKPVEKVIAEIQIIKDMWRNPFIEFADDNTFVNRKHSKKLLKALAREKIRWFTETDISVARDDELLALMQDSGCAQVLIGFECATVSGLQGVEKKSDWKAGQFDFYFSAIEKIQKRGISVNGCFVLGLDGTGLESFEDVRKFVQDSGLHDVQITILTPFPGTPLYERLQESGRIIKEDAWELCTLFDVNFVPDRMTVQELESNFRLLARELYGEGATKERRQRFYRTLRDIIRRERLQTGDDKMREPG